MNNFSKKIRYENLNSYTSILRYLTLCSKDNGNGFIKDMGAKL